MHDLTKHDASTRVDLASAGPASEAALAVAAAAEAIAASAAADVATEAAATAQAAVDAAVLAAATATAKAKTVAASAALAAAAAAETAERAAAPAQPSPDSSLSAEASPTQTAIAALATAHAAATAAAKAVAKIALSVADSAAVTAAEVIEAATLVQAQLLTSAAVTAQALRSASATDPLAVDRTAGGAGAPASVPDGQDRPASAWSAKLVDQGRGLAIWGELDAWTGPLLASEFSRRPADSFGTGMFTLDLTEVSFVDVRGLRGLSDIDDVVTRAGARLQIQPASSKAVAQTLRLAVSFGWLPHHFLSAVAAAQGARGRPPQPAPSDTATPADEPGVSTPDD